MVRQDTNESSTASVQEASVQQVWDRLLATVARLSTADHVGLEVFHAASQGYEDDADHSDRLVLFAATLERAEGGVARLYDTLAASPDRPRRLDAFGLDAALVAVPEEFDMSAHLAGVLAWHEWASSTFDDRFRLTLARMAPDAMGATPGSDEMAIIKMALVDFIDTVARHTLRLRRRRVALTPKQQHTLRQLARGLTDQQIAAELGISFSGVRRRVESLQLKLDAGKRSNIVFKAMDLDYIRPSLIDALVRG